MAHIIADDQVSREPWQDSGRYAQFLRADRRTWAWLWLKRNHAYQAAVDHGQNAMWSTAPARRLTIYAGDLNSLFPTGYLFTLIRPTAVSSNGFSGNPTWIRPWFVCKQGRYPRHLSARSMRPRLGTGRSSSATHSAMKRLFSPTKWGRSSLRCQRAPCLMARSTWNLRCRA